MTASAKLRVQLERMQLLDHTTQAIGAHQEARKVFEVVLRSLEQNLGIDFGCLCLYQAEPRAAEAFAGLETRRAFDLDDIGAPVGELAHTGRS